MAERKGAKGAVHNVNDEVNSERSRRNISKAESRAIQARLDKEFEYRRKLQQKYNIADTKQKEQLEKDLEDVFFNLDEFAEIVNLNGVEVKGIFQSVKYEPFSINKNDSSILGISSSYIKLYYKADATAEVFFVSQQIIINGEYYTVEYIEKEQGMNILTLNKLGAR